jgi:hypothetical protein
LRAKHLQSDLVAGHRLSPSALRWHIIKRKQDVACNESRPACGR